MGKQLVVTFPPAAQVQEIAEAFALAAGSEYTVTTSDGYELRKPLRLTVDAIAGCVGMVHIQFVAGNGRVMFARYHFEFGSTGERGMLLPHRQDWAAIARNVVAQLGGSLKCDEDAEEPDFSAPSKWPRDPEDADYYVLQNLVSTTPGITEADLRDVEKWLDMSYIND